LFDADGPPDFDEITGPVYWPDLAADEAAEEWVALRAWFEQLMMRFPTSITTSYRVAGSFTVVTSKP
jgi:hypothetical protein